MKTQQEIKQAIAYLGQELHQIQGSPEVVRAHKTAIAGQMVALLWVLGEEQFIGVKGTQSLLGDVNALIQEGRI